MTSERILQDRIRAAIAALPDARVWRNNVGLDQKRGVKYGLGRGSPDLVGIVAGRFVGLEVKTATGRVRPEQTVWLDMIRRLGGVAGVARSVEDAMALVAEARGK